METNEPKDRSRSLGGVFPGNEDLIDGWPTAEPYFQGLDQAAESLSANDTRGIAQLGRRVGRFCRFNRTRLARLCEGLTDRSRLAFSCVPYLLHVNEKE